MFDYQPLGNLLRSDVVIEHISKGKYSSKQLKNVENYFRKALWDKFDGDTVGKTVFISTQDLFFIRAATKAAWDLGCSIFNQDGHPGWRIKPEFKELYEFIDAIIVFPSAEADTESGMAATKWLKDWMPEKHIVACDHEQNYDDFSLTVEFDIFKTPAVKTHTSGSWGYPTIVSYSHARVIDLVNYTIEYNQFTEKDRPMHCKVMHHGTLFINYSVPLLMLCKNHYETNLVSGISDQDKADNHLQSLKWGKKKKITRFLIPYADAKIMPLCEGIDLEKSVSFSMVFGPPTAAIKDFFKKFNPKEIYNLYGSAETSNLLVSRTDHDNLDQYHPLKFDIINPYTKIEINRNSIRCLPQHHDSWIIIADRLREYQGSIWLAGRSREINTANGDFDIADIKKFIAEHYQTENFTVVPDYQQGKLYLAVFDDRIPVDLVKLNREIQPMFKFLIPWPVMETFSDVAKISIDPSIGSPPEIPLLLHYFHKRQ